MRSVSHGTEVPFVYGGPPDNSTSAIALSRIMIDYWVSFATSLDPNDGRGIPRTSFFPLHSSSFQLTMSWTQAHSGLNTRMTNRYVVSPL